MPRPVAVPLGVADPAARVQDRRLEAIAGIYAKADMGGRAAQEGRRAREGGERTRMFIEMEGLLAVEGGGSQPQIIWAVDAVPGVLSTLSDWPGQPE